MKRSVITLCFVILFFSLQAQVGKKPEAKAQLTSTSKKIKYVVELTQLSTSSSDDGHRMEGVYYVHDRTEEIYGAISVCLAASGYPATVQVDYTYKNPVDKEIAGGVPPHPQSINPNGRVLWRQSDSPGDRRIHLNMINLKVVPIGTKSVFIFDTAKDPQAVFRFFADMWESDSNDDDEHFNAGQRRVNIPIAEIKVGEPKIVFIQIYDSTSRHRAKITITAEIIP